MENSFYEIGNANKGDLAIALQIPRGSMALLHFLTSSIMADVEIITFDELYTRANAIVNKAVTN